MHRRFSTLLFLFLCFTYKETSALNCSQRAIELQKSAYELRQMNIPLEVHDMLSRKNIQIIGWKYGIAILRAVVNMNGNTVAGTSGALFLALEKPIVHGRYRISLENEKNMSDHHGMIVVAIDRRYGKVEFVGIAEGQEENNPITLEAADLLYKRGASHGAHH